MAAVGGRGLLRTTHVAGRSCDGHDQHDAEQHGERARREAPAGPLAIDNSDYAWRDTPRHIRAHPAWVTPSALRVTGFAAGDALVAHATVVSHGGVPALKPVEIDSGTRASYLADKQASD